MKAIYSNGTETHKAGDCVTHEGKKLYFVSEKWLIENGYTKVEEPEPKKHDAILPTAEQQRDIRIAELRNELAATDYVACKIAEGAATRDDYADILAHRQQLRMQINKLQAEKEAAAE